MIFSSWLTTVSNRIRNASSRRRLRRNGNRNRFTNPAVMQAPPEFGRLSSSIREAVWQTFDASPRWTTDSRRFQRQAWQTSDVALLTEALEDRTLLATFTPNVFTDAAINAGNDGTEFTLREAVIAANSNPGADTINLAPGLYQVTITGDLDAYGG